MKCALMVNGYVCAYKRGALAAPAGKRRDCAIAPYGLRKRRLPELTASADDIFQRGFVWSEQLMKREA